MLSMYVFCENIVGAHVPKTYAVLLTYLSRVILLVLKARLQRSLKSPKATFIPIEWRAMGTLSRAQHIAHKRRWS